jgi:hypothetical protein
MNKLEFIVTLTEKEGLKDKTVFDSCQKAFNSTSPPETILTKY